MALYYQAWFEKQSGDQSDALETLKIAARACPDYCFPNQPEAVVVLEWAKSQNPADARVPLLPGKFLV